MADSYIFKLTVILHILSMKSTIHDEVVEQGSKPSPLYIIYYVTFIGDASRGLLFPALWPLCQQLGGGKVEQGLLVAVFSLGRVCVATRFGIWTDTYRHRLVMMGAACIFLLGVCIWLISVRLRSLHILFVAQFLLGVGTSTLGVTRSYIVETTLPHLRTNMLSHLSALQYAGFSVTPVVGSLLVYYGRLQSKSLQYLLPPLLLLMLVLISIYQLTFNFEDIDVADELTESDINHPIDMVATIDYTTVSEEEEDDEEKEGLPLSQKQSSSTFDHNQQYDRYDSLNQRSDVELVSTASKDKKTHENDEDDDDRTVGQSSPNDPLYVYSVLMLSNFSTRGLIAIYETQGTRVFLDEYHLTSLQLGILVSSSGLLGTLMLLLYKQLWTRNYTDYALILGGLLLASVVQLLVIHWTPQFQPDLWASILATITVYGLGFPISNTAVLGSFSTLQKTGRQGLHQGRFSTVGSIARITMPILTEVLDQYLGMNASYSVVLVMISFSAILHISLYQPTSTLTNRNPNFLSGTPTGKDPLLGSSYVRDVALVVSTILLCMGSYTLIMGGLDRMME